ncbi:hypothetical protein ABID42_003028 [Arcicella rosea]
MIRSNERLSGNSKKYAKINYFLIFLNFLKYQKNFGALKACLLII